MLIVAPHPDDEVFGAGGTLHLAARAGAQVLPVVLADGHGGVDGQAAAAEREAESRRGCSLLGLAEPLFLRLPSAALRGDPTAAGRALAAACGTRFDVVVVPSPLERHATHRAALLAALCAGLGDSATAWWGWGVWEALPLGRRTFEVDITPARAPKALAMSAHASQSGRAFAAGMSARDMSQAIFARATGDEPRRAVERLLDLSALGASMPSPCAAALAAQRVSDWLAIFFAEWADELWAEPACVSPPAGA